MAARSPIERHNRCITQCCLCPRLVEWREQVAREKRASYASEVYWGRPVPGFGDPKARLFICGLAPAAHGGNRTGRVFTGDRSGDWLFAALYRAGFASQPTSTHANDGLRLHDCYVSALVRCAPPANKPTPLERDRCMAFLLEDLRILDRIQAIVCLGGFAWTGVLQGLRTLGWQTKESPRFGHCQKAMVGPYTLLGSYHPSQQNTFTGKLTRPMFDAVFADARNCLRSKSRSSRNGRRSRGGVAPP